MPGDNQTHRNHYVPQWYQKRFLPEGQTKFFYLDMRPEVRSSNGRTWQRRAVRRLGPVNCFFKNDLYTVKLGDWSTDQIERSFFGMIDRRGEKAVPLFSDFRHEPNIHRAAQDLVAYMSAQRFRTPQGLDWLRMVGDLRSHNLTLGLMQRVFQWHATLWVEGVWEIVSARNSPTKFLLTDCPVTFYNPKAFPGSRLCTYPRDVDLSKVGTRTLFSLSREQCLIITHLQFVRNPWANPLRPRENARVYQPTIMNLLDVQFGRELEEDEVLRINLILKQRASRYIAAAEQKWLYPEQLVSTSHWSKLDSDWFLLPNPYKVRFRTTTAVRYKDGSSWVMDEYGRMPGHPRYSDKSQMRRELALQEKVKQIWSQKRQGRTVAHVLEERLDRVYDHMMANDIRVRRSLRRGRKETFRRTS